MLWGFLLATKQTVYASNIEFWFLSQKQQNYYTNVSNTLIKKNTHLSDLEFGYPLFYKNLMLK